MIGRGPISLKPGYSLTTSQVGNSANQLAVGEPVKLSQYDADMKSHITDMVTWLATEKKKLGYEVVQAEREISLSWIHPELGGTADVNLVKRYDTLHMVDLKYGVGYVKAKRNPQLMTYTLGLAHEYSYDFLDYKTTIYQPRYKGKVVRTDTMRTGDLKNFETVLRRGIDACEKKGAKLNVGEWCFFCKCRKANTCPKQKAKALADAVADFDEY